MLTQSNLETYFILLTILEKLFFNYVFMSLHFSRSLNWLYNCVEIERISIQKDKTYIHPVPSFRLATERRKKKNSSTIYIGLTRVTIVGQLPIKARWRDAPLALQDFSQSNKQKMRFQLALNKIFYPNPPPLTHWQSKNPQRTKINKVMLSAFPSSVFYTKFSISELKSK